MGNYTSALQQHDRVFSVFERELPAKDPDRVSVMDGKANALRQVGQLDESLALFKAALELVRRVFEVDSSELLALEGNTASTLSQLGRHKEAADVYECVMKVKERSPHYGPSHESTWETRSKLGRAFVEMGKFSEAVPLLCDSLAAYDGMGLGREHPQLGIIPQWLGRVLLGAGRAAEAVPMFQRSIVFHERKFGLHHYLIPANLLNIAETYKLLGRSCATASPSWTAPSPSASCLLRGTKKRTQVCLTVPYARLLCAARRQAV